MKSWPKARNQITTHLALISYSHSLELISQSHCSTPTHHKLHQIPIFFSYMTISHQWLTCSLLSGFAFGLWVPETLVFLSRLWLSYCALVFVCLMQLSSYMLWIKKIHWPSHWKAKVEFICKKGLFMINSFFVFHVCSGVIHHIETWKA